MKKKNLEGKTVFEKYLMIQVPVTFSNDSSLLIHEELGSGKYNGEEFRLIKSVCNRGFRLEFKDYHLDFNTSDLCKSMVEKLVEMKSTHGGTK